MRAFRLSWHSLLPTCLLSLFLLPHAAAQPPVLEWTFTFASQGNGDDAASGIAIHDSEQVYVVGSVGPLGGSDLILVSLPSGGPPPTWLNIADVEQYDTPAVGRPLALGDAGESYLAASLHTQDQEAVFFVSQIRASGELGWQYSKTSKLAAYAWAIATDPASDCVYAAGYLSEMDPAFSDGWLVQLGAADGAVRWEYRPPATRYKDLRLDAAGSAFVSGEGPIGHFLVAKINPIGQEEWRYAPGVVGSGNRLVLDGAGNVLAVGSAWAGPSGFDIFVAKLSPAGEEIWTVRYGANRREVGVDAALDDEGNAYVAGYLAQESGNIGIAIRLASATGAQEWIRFFADGGLGKVVFADGHLITESGTHDIGFSLHELDPGSGGLHWSYEQGGVTCLDLQWTADAAYICGTTSAHDFVVEKLSNRVTPVDRIDLSPATASANGVVLSWVVHATSSLAGFHVERASSLAGPFDRITDSPIPRAGDRHFTYTDRGAVAGQENFYRICGFHSDGTAGAVSSTAGVLVPAAYPILAVSPNPAHAGVPISFIFPMGHGGNGLLDVIDSSGRHVRSIPILGPGAVRVLWDGRTEGGSLVSAGVYFARIPLLPSVKFTIVR